MQQKFSKSEYLQKVITKQREFYNNEKEIWCPYFKEKVTLNSDGFNHLLNKPNRKSRNIDEQILKLRFLKSALLIIRNSGTVQEIRKTIQRIGDISKDGFYKTKKVQYWAFHAVLGEENLLKIVTVVKRIGEGKIMFWSVLPHKNMKKVYTSEIEEY